MVPAQVLMTVESRLVFYYPYEVRAEPVIAEFFTPLDVEVYPTDALFSFMFQVMDTVTPLHAGLYGYGTWRLWEPPPPEDPPV